jgi:hypothetical protein
VFQVGSNHVISYALNYQLISLLEPVHRGQRKKELTLSCLTAYQIASVTFFRVNARSMRSHEASSTKLKDKILEPQL